MNHADDTLELAEALIHKQTDTYCSELQHRILIAALQGERKTYDQIADDCGYSPKYVKQDVAPKLWRLLSQALDQKVSKANVRSILEQEIRQSARSQASAEPPTTAPAPAVSTRPAIAAPSDSFAEPLTEPPVSLPTLPPLTTSTILLVDDQPKNLRLLSDLLEEQGYEVQQAINGTVALQAVALSRPDLILLDIHMPDMDGYTVCQQLKANPLTRDVPVMFVSASDEAWDKVKAFSSGGSDYITKPFKVVEVLARVENQLKVQQLQQALKAQNLQLRQAIQELQRLAAIDETTQVASRRRFDAYLLTCWQKASAPEEQPISLLLCQVDNFNFDGANSNPVQGDRTLPKIADVLKQTVHGPEDLVSRYGTLTFAVVLPKQSVTEAHHIATTLLKQVEQLGVGASPAHNMSDKQARLTLSIGITTARPTPDIGLEDFLEACARNLQQAKSKGGNCAIST